MVDRFLFAVPFPLNEIYFDGDKTPLGMNNISQGISVKLDSSTLKIKSSL